jgi:dolichol-phosphate mannosyltransferase
MDPKENSPILSVVIPLYNEEQNLSALLNDWQDVFRATGVAYRVILIDDGSKDQSLAVLQNMQKNNAALTVHTQPNAGHGPAILKGYRMALDAEWVFQIDSDHQLDTAAFRILWDNRDNYDLLLAERSAKNASLPRQCISEISKGIVHLFFGRSVNDVNTPYRLMRSERLKEALDSVPGNSFAPNILLTSWFVLKKNRIFMTKTQLRAGNRQRRSKLNGYFLQGALKAAVQTLLFRIR